MINQLAVMMFVHAVEFAQAKGLKVGGFNHGVVRCPSTNRYVADYSGTVSIFGAVVHGLPFNQTDAIKEVERLHAETLFVGGTPFFEGLDYVIRTNADTCENNHLFYREGFETGKEIIRVLETKGIKLFP